MVAILLPPSGVAVFILSFIEHSAYTFPLWACLGWNESRLGEDAYPMSLAKARRCTSSSQAYPAQAYNLAFARSIHFQFGTSDNLP